MVASSIKEKNDNPYQIEASQSQVKNTVVVDVIIPVHNAARHLREAIASAMEQIWILPINDTTGSRITSTTTATTDKDIDLIKSTTGGTASGIWINVCCYNDASTDDSWSILQELMEQYQVHHNYNKESDKNEETITTTDIFEIPIQSYLHIATSPPNTQPRGAGYARNRAIEMMKQSYSQCCSNMNTTTTTTTTNTNKASSLCGCYNCCTHHLLCWLDSDDIMYPTRVYYQVTTILQQPNDGIDVLLGTNFLRSPHDATVHYTYWANHLSDERIWLEQFRECTIIQPTWMMHRCRFEEIGGYLEAPPSPHPTSTGTGTSNNSVNDFSVSEWLQQQQQKMLVSSSSSSNTNIHGTTTLWRLVHESYETVQTLRLAEDLRFYHEHLQNGRLCLCRQNLVLYRHEYGSQSSKTTRQLLLHLRVMALEHAILQSSTPQPNNIAMKKNNNHNDHTDIHHHIGNTETRIVPWYGPFVVWGAGRDGKDFVKALSSKARDRVYCMVDVDDKKIEQGFYVYSPPPSSLVTDNKKKRKKGRSNIGMKKIPIVHFALLTQDPILRESLYQEWKHNTTSSGSCDDTIVATSGKSVPKFGKIDKTSLTQSADGYQSHSIVPASSKPVKIRNDKDTLEGKKDPGLAVLDKALLPTLPVIVCVAMYRSNGALEHNVNMIGRTEGENLWHFS